MIEFTTDELKQIVYGLELLLKTPQPSFRKESIKAALLKATKEINEREHND